MEVAITGADGAVGSVVREAFDPDERRLFVHDDGDELPVRSLEATDREQFVAAVEGCDVLVHLAWGPAAESEWTDGHETNVEGTANALAAAVANDLDRVVLASSIHAVAMAANDRPDRMESTVASPPVVDSTEPARPDSLYGVAKVAVEAMGRFHADRYGTEVVSLRLGWLMPARRLHEVVAEASADRVRFARANWISPRDCRAVFAAAVRADVTEPSLTLPAISANEDRYVPITRTMRSIGYRPRDDAATELDAP